MTFLKHAWYVAAHVHELAEGLVSRTICNEPIVMYRTESGAVAALQDRCPHRFVPLSMGKRVGDTLQCGYHGLAFDTTGACASAPNDPQQQARICVKAYAVEERYNIVWLWMGAPETADPALIPAFDFLSDTEHYAVARGYSHIKANYELLTDNLLDLSHVHYLHSGVHDEVHFSQFDNKLKVEGDTVWSMLWRNNYPLNPAKQKMMELPFPIVDGQGHSRWNPPANILVDTAYWQQGTSAQDGLRSPSAHLFTPETESTTHYFWASGRTNDIHNEPRTRVTEERMKLLFETEDGPMCEAQQAYLGTETDFLDAKPIILKADAAGVAARRVTRRKRREEAALFAGGTGGAAVLPEPDARPVSGDKLRVEI
ncbi:aromatic ring-hydroxylating dioxygenase subunit alpha [Sphingobium sufflavum]|uniref:Rieske 2Fe-2S domain-containing protein n=1 Tax=Sphingobium sufflavum TaxID=1129547 RepID=UPI001F3FF51F|nr:aromatic ring-hydroxylating dioxygenase subunit alpha [Sphingobium sufflavum]MCE7797569.1 aromatic ring-hydroxylating dioxygenase subunit alpha [Sphingobium sufflavum]